MKIEGAAVEYFMQWIGGALKPLLDEDADTDVVAKYIITLLSTDDNEDQLREHCVSQLNDFLSDETEKFVNDLFDAIKRSPYKESLPHDSSARYQDAEYDDHSEWRRGRGRRDGSDDDGSDDGRRYRRGGSRRRYDEDEDDYEYSHKRRRADYDTDRYPKAPREEPYVDRSRAPPPVDSRYDRYERDNNWRGQSREGGHGGQWGRGDGRGDVHNGPRMGGGPAPLPPRGPALRPGYMGGGGMPPDMYDPHFGGGGFNRGLPPGPPGPPPGPGPYGNSFGPYDQGFHPHPPAVPPPLPPLPRASAMLSGPNGPGAAGARPPPPQQPRYSPNHGAKSRDNFNNGGDDSGPGMLDGVPVPHGTESHTVRCTGIPQNVQEKDLFRHFKAFGRIASLKLLRHGGDNNDGRKIYNECYVQFIDPANAKKCVVAPSAVLNNRYIKVFLSNLNVTDPAEAVDAHISFARGYDGTESRGDGPKDRAKRDVQRKYEELKKLRTQEETILKKQEELLEAQIEQHNKILAKLAEVDDSEEKSKMGETLEAKIMSLQFKLREVRERRELSRAASEQSTVATAAGSSTVENAGDDTAAPANSVAKFSSQRGRGAPRGGRFGGRGRGRFGRGGGNMSVDCRPKALLVSSVPDGFTDVAEQHFSRFGKVIGIEKGSSDSGIKVEFSSRYEAEKALSEGAGYGGSMLTLEWAEAPAAVAAATEYAESM